MGYRLAKAGPKAILLIWSGQNVNIETSAVIGIVHTLFVIVGDENHVGGWAVALDVRRDEAEDVRVAEHGGLVDLLLTAPGRLFPSVEDFQCDLKYVDNSGTSDTE